MNPTLLQRLGLANDELEALLSELAMAQQNHAKLVKAIMEKTVIKRGEIRTYIQLLK